MYRIFFLLITFSVLTTQTTFAQFENVSLGSDISISAFPENPEPLQTVTLEVTSYSTDLNQATIVWRYNGKIVSSGIGRTRINVTAPNSGGSGLVTATVSGTGFASSTTALDIRTAKVDLLWEAADSYTPPFYKGKALLSPNGLIRVTAIPAFSAPKNISFEWSRNDIVTLGASGYKKDSFTFRNETLKQQERVSVITSGGLYAGKNNITVTPTRPELVMYKKQEGFVDYANGYLTGIATREPGITLRFEPYFFSVQRDDINNDLVFDIKNNDNSILGDEKKNEVSLSSPDNGGQVEMSVAANTSVYSLQNALRQFTILFK